MSTVDDKQEQQPGTTTSTVVQSNDDSKPLDKFLTVSLCDNLVFVGSKMFDMNEDVNSEFIVESLKISPDEIYYIDNTGKQHKFGYSFLVDSQKELFKSDLFVHIDNFIDRATFFEKREESAEILNYAKLFFLIKRLPAYMRIQFDDILGDNLKLFCTYNGGRFRITGASRMGDIYLNKNHNDNVGYNIRVCINEVTNLGKEP